LGVYFGVYDGLMSYSRKSKYNLQIASLLSGGLAGVATWTIVYPVDYAKTKIQSDSLTNPLYKNSIDCLRTEINTKGFNVIYTGFSIMIARAFIVNAVGFLCF
jgi:solute carrier family 25 carnitine/acylcarnitine transporter 20/29